MNKKYEMLLTWAIFLTFLLQGCMPAEIATGDVLALQPGTTLWVIQRNIDLAWGTIRLQKDNILLLAAYMKDAKAWGYVFLDVAEKNVLDNLALTCGCTGNAVNCWTMSDLVTSALNKGYQIVDSVPVVVAVALKDARSWLHVMPNMPILVLPGAFMEIPAQILPPAGTIE